MKHKLGKPDSATITKSLALFWALLAAFAISSMPVAGVNLGFIYSACNIKPIPADSSFEQNLLIILDEIQRNTPLNNYDYKTHRSNNGTSAYGEGKCNADLGLLDCYDCLGYLKGKILSICKRAVGAKVQLGSCFMHYEAYKF